MINYAQYTTLKNHALLKKQVPLLLITLIVWGIGMKKIEEQKTSN